MTRYALGARGGDMVETAVAMGGTGERTVRSYPLSEDPAMDGANWYSYCANDLVNMFDAIGSNALGWGLGAFLLFLVLWAPHSEGASTIRNGLKFLEAVIIGIVTGILNKQKVSHWT